MPEHVDNLTLAVAVERPNIFAAPATVAAYSALVAKSANGSVFSSATAAGENDRTTGRRRRAPLSARAVQLVAGGVSLRRSPSLAAAVAAAVAFLVLHEMGGGVAEWVADCWHRDYGEAPRIGTTAWDAPDCRERVLRGGSYASPGLAWARCAMRSWSRPARRQAHIGFRVARDSRGR